MENRSEVYARNNNGLKTLPCGTSDTTLSSLLQKPSTITYCDRLDRHYQYRQLITSITHRAGYRECPDSSQGIVIWMSHELCDMDEPRAMWYGWATSYVIWMSHDVQPEPLALVVFPSCSTTGRMVSTQQAVELLYYRKDGQCSAGSRGALYQGLHWNQSARS